MNGSGFNLIRAVTLPLALSPNQSRGAALKQLVERLSVGFQPTFEYRDSEKAWVTGESEDFAAVVLDLGAPNVDGLTVLKRWREEGLRTPVHRLGLA